MRSLQTQRLQFGRNNNSQPTQPYLCNNNSSTSKILRGQLILEWRDSREMRSICKDLKNNLFLVQIAPTSDKWNLFKTKCYLNRKLDRNL